MNERKKACPTVGAAEQAENGNDFAGRDSRIDCTTENSPCRVPRVVDLLLCGAENGLYLSDLVRLTGKDERTIRREIHECREKFIPIVNDQVNGYFIAETADELRRFYRSMTHRAGEILKIARAAETVLALFEGQESMEGW